MLILLHNERTRPIILLVSISGFWKMQFEAKFRPHGFLVCVTAATTAALVEQQLELKEARASASSHSEILAAICVCVCVSFNVRNQSAKLMRLPLVCRWTVSYYHAMQRAEESDGQPMHS